VSRRHEFLLYLIYIKGRWPKRGRGGGWVRHTSAGEFLAEEGAWRWEPYLGVRQADGHFYLSGFYCFLGSGGRALKQHVVPCVNPIL